MINLIYTKLGVGLLVIALGSGAVFVISHNQAPSASTSTSPAGQTPITESVNVHTASWYVAHRDVLKQDEMRCAGDAGRISQAECQNAASADEQLTQIDMQNAAAGNATDDKTGTPHGKNTN
jgi:hypothetical protein